MDTAGNQSQAGGDSLRDGPVLPDIVIAPAHPAHERTEIVFEARPGTAGTGVLPVFSSVRIGDSAVKTGQDFALVGESIWHGITSIF